MKVLCIDNRNPSNKDFIGPIPVEGNIYTVIEQEVNSSGNLGYVLSEMGKKYCYGAWRFIPVSDINEQNFKRNYSHNYKS